MAPTNFNNFEKDSEFSEDLLKDTLSAILKDQILRQQLAKKSFFWFFLTYFTQYIRFPLGEFHKEMIRIAEDKSILLADILGFRGCGKSTILVTANAIWAALGEQQRKFIAIFSDTNVQSRQALTDIKREFETNSLLIRDFGPFACDETEWRNASLVLERNGTRISAFSSGQKVRGIKHRENRPDLIILDDVESTESVKTREGRDKTYTWFTNDILPMGDVTSTKVILLGNYLHDDSLMLRIKKEIESGERTGIFRSYPLVDHEGVCIWPEKFSTPERLAAFKEAVGNRLTWAQEYLLNPLPDVNRIILPEYINHYDTLPQNGFVFDIISVDLAVSEKTWADFTAILMAKVYRIDNRVKIYILPDIINKRMKYTMTIDTIRGLISTFGGNRPYVVVEEAGQQGVLAESLEDLNIKTERFIVAGQDKHSRLNATTALMANQGLFFPRTSSEALIDQLLNFGIEPHDDLVDAFSMLVIKALEIEDKSVHVYWAKVPSPDEWDMYPRPKAVESPIVMSSSEEEEERLRKSFLETFKDKLRG